MAIPIVICDTGGSICEVVDPEDPADPVLSTLAASTLMLWIEDTEAHRAELIRRFDLAPKPMYYHPDFLVPLWQEYLETNAVAPEAVDPDAFVRFAYARALDHRAPLYAAMAKKLGRQRHRRRGRGGARRAGRHRAGRGRPWQTWPDRLGRATAATG